VLRRKHSIPQAIREAVDFCPDGLCFSMPDGRPILVNRQMNRLSALLTGRTVLDAEVFWAELQAPLPVGGGCARAAAPWAGEAQEELPLFALPDGTLWQFRRDVLQDGEQTYIQLEAADVTKLCSLSRKLYENNRRLRELRRRQEELLANIVQSNREKELLTVKMRVHDQLGQCLLATTQSLRGGTVFRDSAALAKGWEDAIRNLTNIPLESAADPSQESELKQVAEMIGCRIDFDGERPADRGAARLLYAAVREALTNAVRHAGADVLTVSIRPSAGGCHVEISDNGRARPAAIREGQGLGNLRRRLEQEGAALEIRLPAASF
jgi:anti-sigma regulatory factor (Ser/Thr protein kinase)